MKWSHSSHTYMAHCSLKLFVESVETFLRTTDNQWLIYFWELFLATSCNSDWLMGSVWQQSHRCSHSLIYRGRFPARRHRKSSPERKLKVSHRNGMQPLAMLLIQDILNISSLAKEQKKKGEKGSAVTNNFYPSLFIAAFVCRRRRENRFVVAVEGQAKYKNNTDVFYHHCCYHCTYYIAVSFFFLFFLSPLVRMCLSCRSLWWSLCLVWSTLSGSGVPAAAAATGAGRDACASPGSPSVS